MSENAITISIASELFSSAALTDMHIQGCRKCVGFSLVTGSGGGSQPYGFSSLWILIPLDSHRSGFSLLLSQCVGTISENAWACSKGLGTSMGPVHIPRVCPSPIPRLIPCLSSPIQRFTPDPIRLLDVFPDSVTSLISVMAHRATHKILCNLWLSNKSPN